VLGRHSSIALDAIMSVLRRGGKGKEFQLPRSEIVLVSSSDGKFYRVLLRLDDDRFGGELRARQRCRFVGIRNSKLKDG
jgi:hypothetical protein